MIGKKSKLGCIIWPTDRCDDVRICNDNKAWCTWDPLFDLCGISGHDWAVPVKKQKKNSCGWKARAEMQKREYMRKRPDGEEGSLGET